MVPPSVCGSTGGWIMTLLLLSFFIFSSPSLRQLLLYSMEILGPSPTTSCRKFGPICSSESNDIQLTLVSTSDSLLWTGKNIGLFSLS